ncbi:hypothetical protein LTR37_003598 [Vermiconidia calcicola]|uniref:Uncharacterized protein n=1 Tax=Vermiconidia calcicola TaxID=1690605 RepID=A0ACC3NRY1_9PEZI|nr:hypothetical protein LTR37_003598 [Vermiconidia calcicola]
MAQRDGDGFGEKLATGCEECAAMMYDVFFARVPQSRWPDKSLAECRFEDELMDIEPQFDGESH